MYRSGEGLTWSGARLCCPGGALKRSAFRLYRSGGGLNEAGLCPHRTVAPSEGPSWGPDGSAWSRRVTFGVFPGDPRPFCGTPAAVVVSPRCHSGHRQSVKGFLLFLLGWTLGATVVGWPLMQVYFSFAVGWPISRRFEQMRAVIPGAHPTRRYLIGGLLNLVVFALIIWACFSFGSKLFLYGIGLGVAIIGFKMFAGTRQAAIEAYQAMRPDLNDLGDLLVEGEFAKHGVVIEEPSLPRAG